MKKFAKEWYIDAPWGKIALASWGNQTGFPILLVHGRQDSAATFIPLLELLLSSYYYVGIDLPGHGKSDPFPIGVTIMRFHFVCAVKIAIDRLNWNKFIFIGHSMGTDMGQFYNAIFPGRITKFIQLDPGPSLQRLQIRAFPYWYEHFYEEYYANYAKYNKDVRIYTKDKATDAVMKSRNLTKEQAELVLSRNLQQINDHEFKLSWDKRLKYPVTINFTDDQYFKLFTMNIPPNLVLASKNSTGGHESGKEATIRLLQRFQNEIPNFKIIHVDGGHDVHLTNPERIAPYIKEFLEKDFSKITSKL